MRSPLLSAAQHSWKRFRYQFYAKLRVLVLAHAARQSTQSLECCVSRNIRPLTERISERKSVERQHTRIINQRVTPTLKMQVGTKLTQLTFYQ